MDRYTADQCGEVCSGQKVVVTYFSKNFWSSSHLYCWLSAKTFGVHHVCIAGSISCLLKNM